MITEIIFEGERVFVEGSLEGYAGCEIIAQHSAMPEDDVYLMVSPEHIASVHRQKAVEAALVMSGYTLTHGLLAEEADALGINITDLAERVLENRKEERDFEVARRVDKVTRNPNDRGNTTTTNL
jgi:hypothetical protein